MINRLGWVSLLDLSLRTYSSLFVLFVPSFQTYTHIHAYKTHTYSQYHPLLLSTNHVAVVSPIIRR
jgi:hypothetical protein